MVDQPKLLSGITVLELAGVLAGPAAGMFFAEMGARVVKVENSRTGGDAIRKWKSPLESTDATTSAYYHSVNWGKEVVFLDLSKAEDLQIVKEYLKIADIVLVNFKAGDAARWHLDNETLRLAYPSLLIGEIKGFAHSQRIAYDAVLQAETGFMSMNGTIESGPLKMPVAFIDILAAHQLKEGLLLALIQRMKTGKGGIVSVSLEETAIASLANQASAYLNNNEVAQLSGSLHPVIAPYGETIKTFDGDFILLAVGTDKQFQELCKILNLDQLASDPYFSTNGERVKNRMVLVQVLAAAMKNFTTDDLLKQFEKVGVPAGRVNTLAQVLNSITAREMTLQQIESDTTSSKRVKTAVFTLNFNK